MNFKRQLVNTMLLYRDCAKEASLGFVRNWVVIPGLILAFIVFQISLQFFGRMGLVGSFILGAIILALLSYYYSWVRETVTGRRLRMQDLADFDTALFFSLMSVAFLFWIFTGLVLEPIFASTQNRGLSAGIAMLIYLLFNPISETVYLKGYESIAGIQFSLGFAKEHWLEWFLPLAIVVSPAIAYRPEYALYIFASTDVMIPSMVVESSLRFFGGTLGMLTTAVGLLGTHWYTLFRGHLFDGLDAGRHRRLVN